MKPVTLFSLIFLSAVFLNAQPQADPQAVFKDARESFSEGDYAATIATLRSWIRKNGKHVANEYIVPLLVEALLREGNDGLAERFFKIYKRKYPDSRYNPRLWYLNGIALARDEEFTDAVVAFSEALTLGVSNTLQSLALSNVVLLSEEVFDIREIELLSERKEMHPRLLEILDYYLIVKLYEAGQTAMARQKANIYRRKFPGSKYVPRVKSVIASVKKLKHGKIQIGLLAPLSGYDADIGKQIVQGVQTAVKTYNKSNTPQINLIISDTRGNMVETARKTLELLNDHDVSLIVGPILSQSAVVTASLLLDRKAIMITPTATDDGIAELGANIFQMNVTLGSLGHKIASYAMRNLNIKEFAIIAPLSDYGMILARTFKDEVRKNGGEIVAEEFFDEGTHDFRVQFESLRSKLGMRMQEERAPERGLSQLGTKTTREFVAYPEDSTVEVGGLFMPAESDAVVMLAPQVFFHKIRTQMLGSTGWHSNKTLLDGKRYVNNAIISTNFEIDKNNQRWTSFRKDFRDFYTGDPDRIAALGYDAVSLYIEALRKNGGDADADGIMRTLSDTRQFKGVSGAISFDEKSGVNTEAAVMKISNKKFIRVQ
ncbi:MAG: ABC transporter substrate-binding protein [Chitinivibrionales bacterium]|nr:ABC transporter substrate-binding protein [Chitinivibrionales bacterium]